MSAGTKNHPYHLVDPSPWPIFASMAAVILCVGAITFMHGGTSIIMYVGFAMVLYSMYVWWRDVIKESMDGESHTKQVSYGLRVGVVLFILSEVFFFVAWFWAFFNASLGGSPAGDVWPPEGITPLSTWGLPFVNTLILVASGFVLEWGHKGLMNDKREQAFWGIMITVIMGSVFMAIQIYEYGIVTFGFDEGIYSSVFFMATGFHGFHVFVGIVSLFICALRIKKGHFTKDKHIGLESSIWYWHFVDIVWIFLFVWVYWWGNSAFFAQ